MRYWLMKSEPSVVGIDAVLALPNQACRLGWLSITPVDPAEWNFIVGSLLK